MNGTKSLLELLANRCSCRKYKPDPVPREHLEKMIEAARLSPSACNRQPWRFVVVTREKERNALAHKALMPGLQSSWIAGAPVIIAMGMHRDFITHRAAAAITKIDYPWIDLGIAGEHLVLQAAELGLGTCWIGWIKPAIVRKIVRWPSGIRPAALITTGWPAEDNESQPTPRLNTSQIATWI
jgi:nitroreductase